MTSGIMFHHFYDDIHPKGQGAISATEFRNMLIHVGIDKILPAEEYYTKSQEGTLKPDDLCLTFDDALLCQYDIAVPVMREFGLTAFWFVYSSVLEGNIEVLEIYRYFRTMAFDDIDDFYGAFFQHLETQYSEESSAALKDFDVKAYLKPFPFYSDNDRKFRYLRDKMLGPQRYNAIMDEMIEASDYKVEDMAKALWMSEEQIKNLKDEKHMIGLHSYSHPTALANLPYESQKLEYQKNFDHLSQLVGPPVVSSHPCNSYNADTLDVLKGLGVKLSFCSNMSPVENRSIWEIPREDHINIAKGMAQ